MPRRAVSKVRVVLQQMEALEERVVTRDKYVGNLGILISKTEGQITAQQRRQEQLNAMVHTCPPLPYLPTIPMPHIVVPRTYVTYEGHTYHLVPYFG